MGNGIFEKISNLINGEKTEKSPEIVNVPDNGIDKKGNLLDAIVAALKSNYAGTNVSLRNYSLLLKIDDSLFYNLLASAKFQDTLVSTVSDELGMEFGSVEIQPGVGDDCQMISVMENCYLGIRYLTPVSLISKAFIYAVEGNGSLTDESVCLDSQKILELPGQRYNIGSGKCPSMSDNSHRENQIAVDDSPSSPEYDKNKYVSRAHAHISYSDEHGFVLYAERGGTRASQKRTCIYRGSDKIELDNVLIPVPLQDGDYIVLSKYVHLLFKKA